MEPLTEMTVESEDARTVNIVRKTRIMSRKETYCVLPKFVCLKSARNHYICYRTIW